MRLLSIFRRCLLEQRHDLLMLALTLIFAPAMVFLYWLFFPAGSTTYDVLVLNNDIGSSGEAVLEALRAVTYADGQPMLVVSTTADRAGAEAHLKDRTADVLLIIPPDFTDAIQSAGSPSVSPADVTFVGDLTNPYYAVAGIMANAALDEYVQTATGQSRPVRVVEQALGASAARTEFENYVPGLLVFAVILLVFLAAMTITREAETGTLQRLRTTRMTALDFLGGISAAIGFIGIVAVLLTFLVAAALGFHSQGPLWVAVLVAAVTSLSIVGVGLIVAAFSRSVNHAFIIANFPLAILMFFSGTIFPLPRFTLFELGGRGFALFDILPTTHAVVALNKVLTLGAGLGDVLYELIALLVLTAVYFAAGVWLFRRSKMRAG